MQLTNVERETIILFNEAEPTANVYTCNARLRNKLNAMIEKGTEGVLFVKSDNYSATYTVPKRMVTINAPRLSRPMTEEQKEKARQRMKLINQKKRAFHTD